MLVLIALATTMSFDGDDRICRAVRKPNSNAVERVCRTREEWDALTRKDRPDQSRFLIDTRITP